MPTSTKYLSAAALTAALLIAGCAGAPSGTEPTIVSGSLGSQNTYTEGVIQNIEDITLKSGGPAFDSTTALVFGAVSGAIIGQLVGRSTNSTIGGATLGAVLSRALPGEENNAGVRLTIETTSGAEVIVEQIFSCEYEIGQTVRMMSQGNTVQMQVQKPDGSYQTVDPAANNGTCATSGY